MTFPYVDGDPIVPLKIQAENESWYDTFAYVWIPEPATPFFTPITQRR